MPNLNSRSLLALVLATGVVAILILSLSVQVGMSAPPQDGEPAPPLALATKDLPDGVVGEYYGVTLYSTGGKRPYGYSATDLPEGLYISRNSDRIMGMPKTPGEYSTTITVKDSQRPTANTTMVTLKIKVLPEKK